MKLITRLAGLATLFLLLLGHSAWADSIVFVGSAKTMVGQQVQIPVMISGVSDLYAFQFDIKFGSKIAMAVTVTEGAFLHGGGPTLFIPGTINNLAGTILFNAGSLLGNVQGVSGSGILAWLTFSGLHTGNTRITISNVILLDSNLHAIPFTTKSGRLQVGAVPEPATGALMVLGFFAIGLGSCSKRWRPLDRSS